MAPPLTSATTVVAACAAAAHMARFLLWRPWKTSRAPLVWVLHVAYLWIPVYLLLRSLAAVGWVSPSLAVHALSVGAVGGLVIGMMTRTARGHAGRPPKADGWDIACYILVIGGIDPSPDSPRGVEFSLFGGDVVCCAWSAAFALYAVRYWTVLTRPRLDGKPG
jgi:uncharacterized protein involved in response to NO